MKTVKKVWSSKTDIKTKLQNPHASKPDAAGLMLSLVPQLPGEGLQILSELLHLRAPDLRWALPDLNRELRISVGTAGPHNPELRSQCAPRTSTTDSVGCRASTPSSRFQWDCQLQISVSNGGAQPRAPDLALAVDLAVPMSERMSDCQIECQIECQKECQNECQNGCQKKCQNECQIEWQRKCQNRCQKDPERIQDRMSE